MIIGVMGLGKLGLPWAQAVQQKGHTVFGYDVEPKSHHDIKTVPISEMVAVAEMIFVIVQTPHQPQFEGTTRLPDERADFDYTYLKDAIKAVVAEAKKQERVTNIVVVSTCLPGTFDKEITLLLSGLVQFAYSPSFTATGSVAEDLYRPEFNLIGRDEFDYESGDLVALLQSFYATLNDAECIITDIATAEAIKVSYNTFITLKTVLANTWGEIAYKMDLDFDMIHHAWSLSTRRLMSGSYLRAGMSDGGACHPRDNIALSWLARKLNLSHDLFGDLMRAREDYEDWHADLAIKASVENDLPLILLGKGFKPESSDETGSAAVLLANLITEKGHPFEHIEDLTGDLPVAVYFIATDHRRYQDYQFPDGSFVINPASVGR